MHIAIITGLASTSSLGGTGAPRVFLLEILVSHAQEFLHYGAYPFCIVVNNHHLYMDSTTVLYDTDLMKNYHIAFGKLERVIPRRKLCIHLLYD